MRCSSSRCCAEPGPESNTAQFGDMGRCAASGVRERSGWRARSSSSLRAQRSNPESLPGKTLDCFATLAMTEDEAMASLFKRNTYAAARWIPGSMLRIAPE